MKRLILILVAVAIFATLAFQKATTTTIVVETRYGNAYVETVFGDILNVSFDNEAVYDYLMVEAYTIVNSRSIDNAIDAFNELNIKVK